jgi:hypothetical protein
VLYVKALVSTLNMFEIEAVMRMFVECQELWWWMEKARLVMAF